MKRVLLTVHKFFPAHRAGTEVLTLKVAQELQRRGYEVQVVTANPPDLDARHAVGPATADYAYEGVPVHVVEESLRLKGYTFRHEFYHPEIKADFEQTLRQFRPDIVHVFHAQNLSASILEAADESGVPVVLSTTDFWFVCPIVQLKRPDGAVCRGPKAGASNCLTCYTPRLFPPVAEFAEAVERKYPKLDSALSTLPKAFGDACVTGLYGAYAATKLPGAVAATVERPGFLRKFANSVRAIMVPTNLMRDIFVENGIDRNLIHHVPFGLDTGPLLAHQEKKPSDVLRIGFIGTVFEHKGVDLLVRAFQSLPPDASACLKVHGDMGQFPEYARSVRAIAEEGGPNSEKISFPGTFPNDRLGEVLEEIDVLVVPSRWYENTPLVIQSAFATRTPVIGTDLGGMSEIIKDGVNGFLFPLNDANELAARFSRLLDDKALLGRLKDGIAPERTTAEMVDDIEGIYEGIRAGISRRIDGGASPEAPAAGDGERQVGGIITS